MINVFQLLAAAAVIASPVSVSAERKTIWGMAKAQDGNSLLVGVTRVRLSVSTPQSSTRVASAVARAGIAAWPPSKNWPSSRLVKWPCALSSRGTSTIARWRDAPWGPSTSTGPWSRREPLSRTDLFTFTNDGGQIRVRESEDGGDTWHRGMAIDVSAAPNASVINLVGDGSIYGNIAIRHRTRCTSRRERPISMASSTQAHCPPMGRPRRRSIPGWPVLAR